MTPNLLIREWTADDAIATRALLSTIAPDYPKFDTWLQKKWRSDASKKVVEVDKKIAAFSMWQHKDNRNVKLQTFLVGPLFRGSAIGRHLLYHEVRTWANDPRIERVYVTVASSKAELIEYFQTYGFRVEGIAANRYPRKSGAAELVMVKHLVRETIRSPKQLKRVVGRLARRVWGIEPRGSNRFGVESSHLAIPAIITPVRLDLDTATTTARPRLRVVTDSGAGLLAHDDESLMRELLPLRIHLENKRYVLVPIYATWVRGMLSTSGPRTVLKLRVDNVYYCYPKVSDLTKGDLVIFYETRKNGGRGAAIGAAVVQEVSIGAPKALHDRFSTLGVYSLADVEAHENRNGRAMAIKFSLFEPFKSGVPLARIRTLLGNNTNVQGLTPISRDCFEAIRDHGL